MSLDNIEKKDKGNNRQYFIQSRLWSDAVYFTHTSWLDYDGDYEIMSRIGRQLLVSKLLDIPKADFNGKGWESELDLYERFVRIPARYLLLVGISANSDSTNFGVVKDPQLLQDEEFARNLGHIFSMKERFEFLDNSKYTALERGLILFIKSIDNDKECIWNVCRLSLDKKLVHSLGDTIVGDAGSHSAALKVLWSQVDNYLST